MVCFVPFLSMRGGNNKANSDERILIHQLCLKRFICVYQDMPRFKLLLAQCVFFIVSFVSHCVALLLHDVAILRGRGGHPLCQNAIYPLKVVVPGLIQPRYPRIYPLNHRVFFVFLLEYFNHLC